MCSICATLLCWKNFTPAKLRMVGVVDRQEPIHFLQEPRGGMWRCSCNHCPNRMGRVQNLWLQVAWKGNRLLGLFMEAKGTKNPPKETHTWTEIDWGCSTTWLEMFGDALVSLYTILYTACTWNLAVAAHLCRFKFRAPKICWLTTDEEFVGFGRPEWLNMSETSLHWHEWHADCSLVQCCWISEVFPDNRMGWMKGTFLDPSKEFLRQDDEASFSFWWSKHVGSCCFG